MTDEKGDDYDAVSQMTSQFQDYLSTYMDKVNKIIHSDVKDMVDKEMKRNEVKTIEISPTAVSIKSDNDNIDSIDNVQSLLVGNPSVPSSPVPDCDNGEDFDVEDKEDKEYEGNDINEGKDDNAYKDISINDDNNIFVEDGPEQSVELSGEEVELGDIISDDDDFVQEIGDVNLVGGGTFNGSSSDGMKTIDLGGIRGGKKFMTRKQRDQLRSGESNFSFFDDAKD